MVFLSTGPASEGRPQRASLASSKFSTPFPVIRGGLEDSASKSVLEPRDYPADVGDGQDSSITFLGDVVRGMVWCNGVDGGRPQLLCAGDRGLTWLEVEDDVSHKPGSYSLSVRAGRPGTASDLELTDNNRPVRVSVTARGILVLGTTNGSLYTVDPTTREVTPFYSPSGEEEEEEDQLIDFDVATGGHLIAMISALGGLKVYHCNAMRRGPVYRRPVSGSGADSTGGGAGVVLSGSSSCRFIDSENIVAVTSGRHIQMFDLRVSPSAAACAVLSLSTGSAGSLSTSLTCLSTQPESGILCAGDSEGRMHVWDWRKGKASPTEPRVSRLAHSVNTSCCCETSAGPSSTLCMVSGGVDGQVCRWLWNPDSHGAGSSTMAPRDQNGQRRSKAERRWWPGLSPTTDSPLARMWNTKATAATTARGASTTIQRFTVDQSTAVTSVAATEGPNGSCVVAYSTDTGVVGLWASTTSL